MINGRRVIVVLPAYNASEFRVFVIRHNILQRK
jgi:hypothetical protein